MLFFDSRKTCNFETDCDTDLSATELNSYLRQFRSKSEMLNLL